MIRKSVKRFSEKIMPNKELKRDDHSSESHRALAHDPEKCEAVFREEHAPTKGDCRPHAMTVSKAATAESGKARKEQGEGAIDGPALQLGELSELLGYPKRAQLRLLR